MEFSSKNSVNYQRISGVLKRARAEPHTLVNLVTFGCHVTVCMYARLFVRQDSFLEN